ncbi:MULTISPECIES: dihydrolipoamide acetyltransferase family protein [unclassified Staphylococcus]|uniref:dihydrolipoamide acetyltransferase family protein n=1 Tax=unclassified Staphylococcus TaxID=91994 RepID=UPI0021CE3C58|nr:MULTISPECIES: dihydrolipoamide acetyltransferase family protein [unclassified Staphylococcus]UXR79289.1 2-oxo acid dehydrogenase subunit E2 [Staphylococcus sp. IVB6227]UXR81540.1 2-oxo acid dehydrogenase subunit E2 [Staphylococcus sp. IVB6214]
MEIKMPKLGESVHEGTIEQWLVSVGDRVEEYDPLCEIITDKVTAEVPSSYAGVVTALHVEPGDIVSIGTVICSIEVENRSQYEDNHALANSSSPASETTESSTLDSKSFTEKNNGRYSPVVFKLASTHEIDLNQVPGTGFNGRVTKKDMLHYIETNKQAQNKTLEQKPKTIDDSNDTQADKTIPVNGVRRQIANKMAQSVQEIPHAWMQIEVDATELVKTREHYKGSFKEQEGYNLTYFAFFIKAVAETLKKYPMLNSSWQNDEIVIHDDIHLSIAVAHNDQLYVPVIHHADEKSIKGIAKEIHTLAKKVRNNQLTTSDMTGGTFTVNNTGTFGSVSSMGIINHPQAAILQVESIVKRPVIINDMIAIRHMVNLCLSIDHRILDGLQAGMFLNDVKQQIEHITLDQTSIY